jgi:hypothetical protein
MHTRLDTGQTLVLLGLGLGAVLLAWTGWGQNAGIFAAIAVALAFALGWWYGQHARR